MRRRGPRPLLLHLTRATGSSSASNSASPNWSGGLPNAMPAAADPTLIAGIAAYRRHPYQRALPEPPVLWQEGGSRLLDYGGPAATTVLFVPSLVNRAHILDLSPMQSLLRWLAGQGVRPLLLDWGWPDAVARGFTLTDYVAGRIERALAACGPEPVVLAGYCMGGLLALAAALRRPDRVRALALLATPWDFHAPEPAAAQRLAAMLPMLEPALAASGTLPVDALQMLFAIADPDAIAAKYRGFAAVDPDSERARQFVAMEDWLNDGVPMAAPVARECLAGWYGANTPGNGTWRIAGAAVEPGALRMPALVALPARDRIVPAESALPLAVLIPGATLLRPRAGHVGMVAGRSAEAELWRPLLEWLGSVA